MIWCKNYCNLPLDASKTPSYNGTHQQGILVGSYLESFILEQTIHMPGDDISYYNWKGTGYIAREPVVSCVDIVIATSLGVLLGAAVVALVVTIDEFSTYCNSPSKLDFEYMMKLMGLNTLMQKVIPVGDIEKYMDGTYTQVGGYVTRAEDVIHLTTYEDIYNSLRLDYPGSAYDLVEDGSLGVIRYITDEVSKISIPYSVEMGGTTTGESPFTGNGFTKAMNGQIIPEYICDGYLEVSDGAQLIEIFRDGTEILRAVYSKIDKMFIPVD